MSGGDGKPKGWVHGPAKGAGWGGPARGTGTRPPFEKGHDLSVTHGAYRSELKLQPRAEEIAVLIRQQLDEGEAARFALLVSTAAALGARAETALLALTDPTDPATSERLNRDARGWTKLWLSALTSLGLTPASARQAANDIGLKKLAEHITATYAGAVEGEATDG